MSSGNHSNLRNDCDILGLVDVVEVLEEHVEDLDDLVGVLGGNLVGDVVI